MSYGGLKSTWSSVKLNLFWVHLFWLNLGVSLTVKHYSMITEYEYQESAYNDNIRKRMFLLPATILKGGI